MREIIATALVALALTTVGCSTEDRDPMTDDSAQASMAADNTGTNERDRNSAEMTPLDQGESETDRAITQEVRQVISANESLSMNAKNVKIITSGSVVTLRGPIDNSEERTVIVSAAQGVSGVTRVDDQLELVAYQGN